MKRKLLVSLLVLSMVLCLLPAGAAADGIVGTEFNTVSAGQTHVSAIDSNGALWTWGCNGAGQLGNGGVIDVKGNYPENGEIYQSMPIKIMDDVVSVSTNKATDLAVGGSVTGAAAAVKSDGSLWVWGRADLIGTGGKGNRENGDGDKQNSSKDYYYQDVPVKIMDDVASVSMGAAYSFALKRDGSLFSWGPCGTPVKIMDDVLSVSAGGNNVAVIKNDNTLWVCVDMPYEDYYDHDTNEYYEIYDPQKIKLEKVMDGVAAVSAGSGDYGLASYQPVFAAIKTDGSLWAWGGLNGYNGGINNRLDDPIKIMDKALSVSVADQIEAVKSDNSLWRFEFSYNGNAKWNEPTSPADWSFKQRRLWTEFQK